MKAIFRTLECLTPTLAIERRFRGEICRTGRSIIRGQLPERSQHREQRGHDCAEPPLQAPRRADAKQLPHEEPEIEVAGVDSVEYRKWFVLNATACHPLPNEIREGLTRGNLDPQGPHWSRR